MEKKETHKKVVGWKAPSNIALVKYWGKKTNQIPQNPSLSLTLSDAYTETTIAYEAKGTSDNALQIEFLFEGKKNLNFEEKIRRYFATLIQELPFISRYNFHIQSFNSFPHSSGIASSAASMASIALCLMSIYEDVEQMQLNETEFFQRASYFARLGSGSASRSVFGGFSLWGKTALLAESADEFAIPYHQNIHDVFAQLRLAVLLVSGKEKEVSSSQGHALMHQHPFAHARFEQANQNLEKLMAILASGDKNAFFELIENEALSLHAMMMTSHPSFILLQPNSLKIIELIRLNRREKGLQIGFTIDAGANIHLIYFEDQKKAVHEFIQNELLSFCENEMWIDDKLGHGPTRIGNI